MPHNLRASKRNMGHYGVTGRYMRTVTEVCYVEGSWSLRESFGTEWSVILRGGLSSRITSGDTGAIQVP